MARINYRQPIRVGGQTVAVPRSENFGEDWTWRTFKLYSAVLLWVLGGVFVVAGGVWFYSRFYFNGLPPLPSPLATTSTTSSKPPSTRVVLSPLPSTVVTPSVPTSSPPSVVRVDIPKIEIGVEVETKSPPPPPSVAVDPTANLTPWEKRQRQIWRHE